MTSQQFSIIERLRKRSDVITERPEWMNPISELPDLRSRIDVFNRMLFAEIGWFFAVYRDVGIFCDKDFNGLGTNSWDLGLLTCIGTSLADTFLYGERRGDCGDYLFNFWQFATNLEDGGVGLGICSDSENFGRIACCTFTASSERGDVPIVANSFTEWLERTLDYGPEADCFYWEDPEFVDLGPAIPGDPNYRRIGRIEP